MDTGVYVVSTVSYAYLFYEVLNRCYKRSKSVSFYSKNDYLNYWVYSGFLAIWSPITVVIIAKEDMESRYGIKV